MKMAQFPTIFFGIIALSQASIFALAGTPELEQIKRDQEKILETNKDFLDEFNDSLFFQKNRLGNGAGTASKFYYFVAAHYRDTSDWHFWNSPFDEQQNCVISKDLTVQEVVDCLQKYERNLGCDALEIFDFECRKKSQLLQIAYKMNPRSQKFYDVPARMAEIIASVAQKCVPAKTFEKIKIEFDALGNATVDEKFSPAGTRIRAIFRQQNAYRKFIFENPKIDFFAEVLIKTFPENPEKILKFYQKSQLAPFLGPCSDFLSQKSPELSRKVLILENKIAVQNCD